MANFTTGLVIGLTIGTCFGVVIAGLLRAGKDQG